jgi:hypothetical protein
MRKQHINKHPKVFGCLVNGVSYAWKLWGMGLCEVYQTMCIVNGTCVSNVGSFC